MSLRPLAVLLLALAPLAAAHGSPAPYDPLVVELHAFLTSDGALSEAAPQPGAVAFPAGAPPAGSAPLRFEIEAPVRFVPSGGFAVDLALRADAPVVAGDGLELAIEPGGEPARVPLPEPVLAPGETTRVLVRLQASGAEYAEGDPIALVVRPLMPGLTEGALSVVVGGDVPSRVDALDMRVPTPADLGLQSTPLTEFILGKEEFASSAGTAVNVFRVGHDVISRPEGHAWSTNGTYVVLRGEEAGDVALQHSFVDRERRIGVAHEFSVNGIRARVHPGLGVVVPVTSLPIRVVCVANCPTAGFSHTIDAPGSDADAPPAERPSVLVPPPRETRGIPVSEDEDAPRNTPLAGTLALLAALTGVACYRKR